MAGTSLHQRLRLVFSNSAGAEERLELLEPIPASTEPQLAQSSFSLTRQSEMFDADKQLGGGLLFLYVEIQQAILLEAPVACGFQQFPFAP